MSDTPNPALLALVQSEGLDEKRGQIILNTFGPIFMLAESSIRSADATHVSCESDADNIEKAALVKKSLAGIRIELERTRKDLKEDSLRLGKGIDKVARMIRERIEPAEARMEELAKFKERAEEKRRTELHRSRAALLEPFGVDLAFYNLGAMTETVFQDLLTATKRQAEVDKAARDYNEKAEAERKAAAEAEAIRLREENERLRNEQAKLRSEQDAERRQQAQKDAAAKTERDRLQAEADAAQQKLRDAERAEQERKNAEARAAKAKTDTEARAAKRAASAPDVQKLKSFLEAMRAIPTPDLSTATGSESFGLINDIFVDAFRKAFAVIERM